jgi:tetratricopeptide (TPR) repeat protein
MAIEVALSQGSAVPRNDECPCGTGLKHKHCCGWLQPALPDQDTIAHFEGAFRLIENAAAEGNEVETQRKCIELLNQAPGHIRALNILYRIQRRHGRPGPAEVLARRVTQLLPNNAAAAGELALLLYERGEFTEAEQFARNMVRLEPDNAQGHNLMGMIFTETRRLLPGEFHYRKALQLHGAVGKLCANLGYNLKSQGKLEEAEDMYRQAMQLEPDNMVSLMGWIQTKEAGRRLDEAWELYRSAADRVAADNINLSMTAAVLHRRQEEYEQALAALDRANPDQRSVMPAYHYERGAVLDRLQRYGEAFASYAEANRLIRERANRSYNSDYTEELRNRLKAFFIRPRMQQLPRGIRGRHEQATPIFIVGFPRSGTTMVEQILTSLPQISAGDELPFIWEMTGALPKMLNSNLYYPECLADLWFGDNQAALETLRDFYLKKVYQLNILESGAEFFTDKMPLNETNLGLIHLIFPEAPVVHLLRHPLDVVLSCFFNDLTHGNNCSYELEAAARHYVLVRDLVDHYLEHLDANYTAMRYEDIVDDPERYCRKLVNFIGVDWDPSCLEFHKNPRYARTASYAQVTESLYSRSVFRYRNYIDHLEPVIPVLEPVIKRLGYTI